MKNQILTSLSIITSFHNKNASILDTFLPIVEYGIATLNVEKENNHYDTESLQKKIFSSTGIKINSISLKSLLKKLAKNQEIILLEKEKYFSIGTKEKPKQDVFLSAQREKHRTVHHFIKEYKTFSNDQRDEYEIQEWIYNFITDYCRIVSINNTDITLSEEKEKTEIEYNKLVAFLEEINKSDNELVKTFFDIYFGYNIYSIFQTQTENIGGLKLNNIKVYLDSNFILRLIDLQESNYCKETRELFELLKTNNTKLLIFQETIIEIKSVIRYYLEKYKNNKEQYLHLLNTPEYIDGVLGSFYRRKLSYTNIENIIESLDSTIKSLGISIDNIERYKILVKEEEVQELYDSKYGELTIESDDEESIEYRKQKAYHYQQIIKIIDYHRKTHNVINSCLGNCGFVFLTCDYKLYNYNRKNAKKYVHYTEIITQEIIANDLLLFFPQAIGKISIDLMVSLFSASKYINVHILDNLSNTIKEIAVTSQEDAQYVIMATRNAENYADINDIYEDDSIDNKTGILDLAQKAKEAENKGKLELEEEKRRHEETIILLQEGHENETNKKDDIIRQLKTERDNAVELYKSIADEQKKQNIEKAKKEYKKSKFLITLSSLILYLAFGIASAAIGIISVWQIEFAWKWLIMIVCVIFFICSVIFAIRNGLDNEKLKEKMKNKKDEIINKYNFTDEDI